MKIFFHIAFRMNRSGSFNFDEGTNQETENFTLTVLHKIRYLSNLFSYYQFKNSNRHK